MDFLSLTCAIQIGSILRTFSITDRDTGLNSIFQCTLFNDTDHTFSVISGSSLSSLEVYTPEGCTMTLSRQLDYEDRRDYRLILLAQDHGTPPRSSMAVVMVTVTNVADTKPSFNQTSFTIHVREDVQVNHTVATITATTLETPPYDLLYYRLLAVSQDVAGTFQVGGTSGALAVASPLNSKASQSLLFLLQAYVPQRSELWAETLVTVIVTDVNNHPPMFGRGGWWRVTVPTMQPEGTYITTAAASDEDSDSVLTYSFSSATPPEATATFAINSSTGVIVTKATALSVRVFSIEVVAKDNGTPSFSSTATIQVDVLNTPLTPPSFQMSKFQVNFTETSDTRQLFPLPLSTATTTENRIFQYFIQSGNRGGVFNVSGEGVLQVLGTLDRETRSSYDLLVVVVAMGDDVSLEAGARVQVLVSDVNDCEPVFWSSGYRVAASEDAPVGTRLVQVSAMDCDEGSNSLVRYSIVADERASPFTVDPVTGWVQLRQSLDYEASSLSSLNHTHYVVVMAVDGGMPPLSSTVIVEVQVEDINDNPPTFSTGSYTFEVAENCSLLTPIARLSATDQDSAGNPPQQFWFELVDDASVHESFLLTEEGWLLVGGHLDRETRQYYQLTVRVWDNGRPPLSSTTSITVGVTDVIDDPPWFLQQSYLVSVISPLSSGSVVTRVEAVTGDLLSGICYSILSPSTGSLLFNVSATTGDVVTTRDVDPVADAGNYTFTVRAEHRSMLAVSSVEIVIGSPPLLPAIDVYFSAYLFLLPQSVQLACLTSLSTQFHKSLSLSLNSFFRAPSSPIFDLDFSGILSVSGIESGSFSPSVLVADGMGFSVFNVSVHIGVLDNDTLDHAVGVRFGGVTMETFTQLHLRPFLEFVAVITDEEESDVVLCGIQSIDTPDFGRGVEVILVVKSPDILVKYYSPLELRALLLSQVPQSPLTFTLSPNLCDDLSCPSLQTCRPVYHVHPTLPATPTIILPGTVYHLLHTFFASHKCTCPQGYSISDACSTEINECETYSPCLLGAECMDNVNDYTCECPEGVAGKNCSDLLTPPTQSATGSCSSCDSTHCRYNGECCLEPSGTVSCTRCPWGDDLSGPNCQLVYASFSEGSYLVLATPTSTTRFVASLSFATVSSGSLLLYVGSQGAGLDHVAAEVLFGQVRVSVSFGDVATVLMTESREQLNDGDWHRLTVEIRDRVSAAGWGKCSAVGLLW